MTTKIQKNKKNIILASILIPIYVFNHNAIETCVSLSSKTQYDPNNLLDNSSINNNNNNNINNIPIINDLGDENETIVKILKEKTILKDENGQFLQLFAYILQNMQQYNALQNDKNEDEVTNTTQNTQSDLNLENNTTKEKINTIQNNLANIQQQIIDYIFNSKPGIINQLKDIINNNIDDDSISESNNNKIDDKNNDIILNKGHKLLISLLILHHFTPDNMLDSISSNITYHTLKKTLNDILYISCKGITLDNKNYNVKFFTLKIKNEVYKILIHIVYEHAELCRKISGNFFLVENNNESDTTLNLDNIINQQNDLKPENVKKSDQKDILSSLFFANNEKYKNICKMTIQQIQKEKQLLNNCDMQNIIIGKKNDSEYYQINFKNIKTKKEQIQQLLQYFEENSNKKFFSSNPPIQPHIQDIKTIWISDLYTQGDIHNDKPKNMKYTISRYIKAQDDEKTKTDLEKENYIYIYNTNKIKKMILTQFKSIYDINTLQKIEEENEDDNHTFTED